MLQIKLLQKGFPVVVTGIFDSITEVQIVAHQAEVGLRKTGKCDAETWETINN